MEKIKVAILDDHLLFRTGICELVNKSKDFVITCSAGTPEELYACIDKEVPALLILDIRLKETSGLDVLKYLKQRHGEIKIVMLTMHEESSFVRQMIEQGADGYLLKDIAPEELFRCLRNVLSLGKYYGQEITSLLIQSLQHKETLGKTGIVFTEIEIEILTLISEGYTAEEIAGKMFRAQRTIEGHRQKLLDKTHSKNIASLISWAYKNGVLYPG